MKDNKKIQLLIIAIVIAISSVFIYKGAIAPKLYDKYLNTGIKYLMDGEYEEAILAFDKAIKIDNKSTEARVHQSKAYIGNEQIQEAVDVLEEAQNIDIRNEELLKEILEILNEIDSDIAYEFLDRFMQEVGEDNISSEIKNIFDTAYETPQSAIVDPEPGTYTSSISVKIKQDKIKVGHSYYYTTDGSNPNKDSKKYRGQIKIDKDTIIKLIGYNKDNESTEVMTFEYIIDKNIVDEVRNEVTNAENLINDTNVGKEIGDISKVNKDKLQFIIDEAKDILKEKTPKYNDISNLKDKIENGIMEFENNIIKPVDKSKLKSAISQANQLYNNAIEGSQKGQYKSGSKSILMSVISKAEQVYNNESASQDKVNEQVSSLNSAISSFNKAKITQSDKNPDGSYTREYVNAYIKRKYPDFNISVEDAFMDEKYNNELCYFVFGMSIETNASGFTKPIEFYIGSKTLKEYIYSDVAY